MDNDGVYIKPDDQDSGVWVRQVEPLYLPEGLWGRIMIRLGLRRPVRVKWFGAESQDENEPQ